MRKQSHGPKSDGPVTSGGCDPCGPSRRNRYYRDKRMHAADYVLEQNYQLSRRRLVNRAMLGWGVVQGFRVDPEALTIGPGIALDPQGRELVACEPVKLACADDVLWLGEGEDCCGLGVVEPPREPIEDLDAEGRNCDEPDPDCPPLYLLSAHYAEKRIDPVRLDDGCGGVRCEANAICETVVYSLRPIACCEAGLPDCRCPTCAGDDRCACDEPEPPCGDDTPPPPNPDDPKGGKRQDDGPAATKRAAVDPRAQEEPAAPHSRDDDDDCECFTLDRGNHRQLALWSLDPLARFDACKPGKLVETAGCLAFDPRGGVPLACVTITFRCGEPRISGVIDAAHPRRLARSNETLFDLIRGCDLTRIKDVGWSKWLPADRRRVPLSEFADMFEPPTDPPDQPYNRRRRPHGSVVTRFTVEFTGPVRVDTLTTDVIAISLIQREPREDVGDIVRVPIFNLSPKAWLSTDPPGTTRSFTVLVEKAFWEGEINPDDVSAFDNPTLVEIEIRTDWILDCNGQEVAGGGRGVPSTGSVPGGRFLSSFTVLPNDQREPDAAASASIPSQEA